MKLTSEQETIIQDFVTGQGLTIPLLRDDLIDHLCCVIESELGKEKSFEQLFNEAVTELAPNGLMDIEHETIFLLNANRIKMMKKLTYLIGFMSVLAFTAGVMFKLLHWPGAGQLFMTGYLTLFLVFIPLLAFDRFKVSIAKVLSERLKIIFGLSASVAIGLGGLFKIMHLQGAELLLILGAIVFAMGFLPFFFFTMYKKSIS